MSSVDAMDDDCKSEQTCAANLLNIQNELIWGLSYRNYKEKEKHKPMIPIHSPIDIPFEICRAELLQSGKGAKKFSSSPKQIENQEEGRGDFKKRVSKKKKTPPQKPTLLERNIWPQKTYMEYLSIPSRKIDKPKQPKSLKKCEMEPCPPRFVHLAVPKKQRVLENWKDYQHFLPAEVLMRFEEILHTDQNLDPRDARYYYKKLDRKKRLLLKKKRKLEKKKKLQKNKAADWLKTEIENMANDIVNYIKEEPLFALNYKQLLISDGIMDRCERAGNFKKPSRKTKNHYKKTIIEITDKFSIWIDTLTKFVDVQVIDSDADIAPLSICSLAEEGGEGEEDEYESSLEEEEHEREKGSDIFVEEGEDLWGEMDKDDKASRDQVEGLIHDIFKPGEGEDGDDIQDMIDNLNEELLDKLIQILSNCSDEFLNSAVDEDKMPDVKYQDILDQLKTLKDRMENENEKTFIEKVLVDWAMQNDPANVDDQILNKIHEVSQYLEDLLMTKRYKKIVEDDQDVLTVIEDEEIDDGAPTDQEDDIPEADAEDGVEGEDAAEEAAAEEAAAEEGVTEAEEELEGEDGIGGDDGTGGVDATEADDGIAAEDGTGGEADAAEADVAEEEDVEDQTGDETEGIVEAEEGQDDGESPEGEPGVETDGEFVQEEGEEGENLPDIGIEEGEEYGTIYSGEHLPPGADEEEKAEEPIKPEDIGTEDGDRTRPKAGPEAGLVPKDLISGVPEEKKTPKRSGLNTGVIKGHRPPQVVEHSPGTVCCLSLKTWAMWLLEVIQNALNWTQWLCSIIQTIKECAAIVRGEVLDENLQPKVLKKSEWRKFCVETDESICAWRQYSCHVNELSEAILDNFHGKSVTCCPKCLQDNLIIDLGVAHNTVQALTDAVFCASYWQGCIDKMCDKAMDLTGNCFVNEPQTEKNDSDSSSSEVFEILDYGNEDSDDDTGDFEIDDVL